MQVDKITKHTDLLENETVFLTLFSHSLPKPITVWPALGRVHQRCVLRWFHISLTSGVLSGPSAGEGWLPGGGVGKLQEATARLPLHRSAPLCQDEEDGCGVSPLYLFPLHQNSGFTTEPFEYPLFQGVSICMSFILPSNVSTSTPDSETERMTLYKRSCLSFCSWLCRAGRRGFWCLTNKERLAAFCPLVFWRVEQSGRYTLSEDEGVTQKNV